jgi:hypothetical protein
MSEEQEEVKKPRATVQVAVDFDLMNRLYALRAKLNAPDNRINVRSLVEEAITDLLDEYGENNESA